jgi:hypothetical protein
MRIQTVDVLIPQTGKKQETRQFSGFPWSS